MFAIVLAYVVRGIVLGGWFFVRRHAVLDPTAISFFLTRELKELEATA